MLKQLRLFIFISILVLFVSLFSKNMICREEKQRELSDINNIQALKEQFENQYKDEEFKEIMENKFYETSCYEINLGYETEIHKTIEINSQNLQKKISTNVEFMSLSGRSWKNKLLIYLYDDMSAKVGLYTNEGEIIKCNYIDDVYLR